MLLMTKLMNAKIYYHCYGSLGGITKARKCLKEAIQELESVDSDEKTEESIRKLEKYRRELDKLAQDIYEDFMEPLDG